MTARASENRIDTSRPHPARVYDWLLGGKDHYPVDRAVAEQLPPEARHNALRNRAFMHRAAAWLAGNGVDQYPTSARASRPSPTSTRSCRTSCRRPGSRTPTTIRSC